VKSILLATAVFLFSATGLAAADSIEKADPVTTATPMGTYTTAWLHLSKGCPRLDGKGASAADVPLFLGLREGRCVVAWFAHPDLAGQRIVWLDRATLSVDGPALKGELKGRTNLNWGNKLVHDYVYTFDAKLDGGTVTGSFTATFTPDQGPKVELAGKLTGKVLSTDAARKGNELSAGKNWPHYYGDGYGLAAPTCGVRFVDDLALARPVWKSEAFVPTGYGSAPDSRYFDRAGLTDAGGGSSSPVVVDGRVYQFYYYPRGPVGLDKAYGKYETEADLVAIAKRLFPNREVQQRAAVNHFRTQADEVVVCLDAATGQTLWKTTLPQRGNNYQTHKHRGLFPVPLVSGNVVYQPGTTGRLYALDAATGKLRWEYPNTSPMPYTAKQGGVDCHAPSPVLVGDTVVFAAGNGVVGVDAQTGKKNWEQPLWTRSSLPVWKGSNRTLVLATDRDHQKKQDFAVAIDPTDGKVLWRQPVEFLTGYTFPLLAGDIMVGYSLKLDGVKPGENDGLAVVHAYRISENGLEKTLTTPPLAPIIDTVGMSIQADRVYVTTAAEAFCLKLDSGERLASAKGVGGARTQTAFLADGRLFVQPEGRHGKQAFLMADADPKNFRLLGAAPWLPPHSWTTAYANQPIVYPLVDGRLFVRGLDAIYCYDLRQPAP
jgi:outer membrane protein assembly factor BamB